MTRPRPRSRIALVLVGALALGACTGKTSAAPSIPAVNATTASLLPTTADALPPADPATFQSLLEQLRGTPVVVNFWASWCEPCKTETPLLVAAHRRYGDRVQFVGIDLKDSASGARRFIADEHMTYPSVFDPEGAIGTAFSLLGPPGTLFYTAAGKLVARSPGQISAQDLQRNMQVIAG